MNNNTFIDMSTFSSINLQNRFQQFNSFLKWYESKCCTDNFYVEQIPFRQMEKWQFDDNKSRLFHESGRFFSVEGIHVKTNFGEICEWEQPIINQPEIGILGIITKIFDGTRYFLMQAKMEPGNLNTLQLSPTVQATKSNFTRAHEGKLPLYLEYFIGSKKVKILIDQLQTEQSGRFFQKRNRNIIIEIFDEIDIYDDFCWLTLAELKFLLHQNNILNMDTRSVLSTISLGNENILSDISSNALYSINDIIAWYNQQKLAFELEVTKKPLAQLKNWKISENSIYSDKRFFSVIGVKVSANTREVTHWMQPLIKDENIGLLVFFVNNINGILHFLVQAKVQPGNKDIIELSPTVSCSNYLYITKLEKKPFMFDEVFNPQNIVHLDSLQSEEGGRFYQVQNRNMIIELTHFSEKQQLPANYTWFTLGQMNEFLRYGLFSIEARSIISAISFMDKL
jgi:oxidase EvaA